jgi:putative NADH-flavin reductase
MRIALFGAAGGTGRQFIRQACASGHEVTSVVRDPTRLTESHPRLRVLRADVMDPRAISPALAGCDAVVSALGSRDGGCRQRSVPTARPASSGPCTA